MTKYVELNCRMFEEVGAHYGPRLAAYWLDSYYQPYIKWGHLDIDRLFAASKTGWKDRMVAFNHWVFPVPTLAQDYWASEMYQTLARPPAAQYFRAGAAKGLLYHALYSPDCHWGQPKVVNGRVVEKPIWPAEVFAGYLKKCIAVGGVVTINLGCFPDGSISPYASAWMRRIRRLVRG